MVEGSHTREDWRYSIDKIICLKLYACNWI